MKLLNLKKGYNNIAACFFWDNDEWLAIISTGLLFYLCVIWIKWKQFKEFDGVSCVTEITLGFHNRYSKSLYKWTTKIIHIFWNLSNKQLLYQFYTKWKIQWWKRSMHHNSITEASQDFCNTILLHFTFQLPMSCRYHVVGSAHAIPS